MEKLISQLRTEENENGKEITTIEIQITQIADKHEHSKIRAALKAMQQVILHNSTMWANLSYTAIDADSIFARYAVLEKGQGGLLKSLEEKGFEF